MRDHSKNRPLIKINGRSEPAEIAEIQRRLPLFSELLKSSGGVFNCLGKTFSNLGLARLGFPTYEIPGFRVDIGLQHIGSLAAAWPHIQERFEQLHQEAVNDAMNEAQEGKIIYQ